jgi:hypothetical protein
MATYYHKPDPAALAILRELRIEHRQDLEDAEADIRLVFASSDKVDKPAMTSRGQRVLGKCKVHSLADKASGTGDATITIDGFAWLTLSTGQRRALLHHELEHIDVWGSDCDDTGRPLLKSRNADFEFDGFHRVLELYGQDAIECRNVARVVARHQAVFTFAMEPEEAVA